MLKWEQIESSRIPAAGVFEGIGADTNVRNFVEKYEGSLNC